ncbi:MAG: IclR family transcriptional regulator [Spirochaetia bacterium]|jgi:IclR family KDG regulon transcriptional repressor|nr:IclR family transcriptional regulator [Spirochaetia bacterium]
MEETKGQSNAAARTISILEILSVHKKINLENLSKESHLPKATLLRFLTTLTTLGYVHRDGNDLYSLTLKLFSVGSRCLQHIDLLEAARPEAETLSNNLGETVHMGIMEDSQAVYILKVESSHTIRMYSRVGKTIPLYCTAIGKVLLSGLTQEQQETYMEKTPLIPFTPQTLDRKGLEKELKAASLKGWAWDAQEHEQGITCIAGRITDYTGKTVAALSVSWPQFRFKPELLDNYCGKIKESCRHISSFLGTDELQLDPAQ